MAVSLQPLHVAGWRCRSKDYRNVQSSDLVYFMTPTVHLSYPSGRYYLNLVDLLHSTPAAILHWQVYVHREIRIRGRKHGSRWLRRDRQRPMPRTSHVNCCTVSCPPVAVSLGAWRLAPSTVCGMVDESLSRVFDRCRSSHSQCPSCMWVHCFDICRRHITYGYVTPCRQSSAVTSLRVHPSLDSITANKHKNPSKSHTQLLFTLTFQIECLTTEHSSVNCMVKVSNG